MAADVEGQQGGGVMGGANYSQIPYAVIDRIPEIGLVAYAVYGVLARYADRAGTCFPSVAKIANDIGSTKRSIHRALETLATAGLISVVRRTDKRGGLTSNLYTLLVHPSDTDDPTPSDTNDPRVVTPAPLPSDTGAPTPSDTRAPVTRTSINKNHLTSAGPDTSDDIATARWMRDLILAMQPKRKEPDLAKWADEIRRMRTCDARTDAEIRETFGAANRDEFWRTNILSPAKLREKYDDLRLKLHLDGNGKHHANGRSNSTEVPGLVFQK